ncbi:unnamed protein product [Cylicocyclus nassatus]|uniref:Uncharacterized protein n=1 Tax=Cylicocyclus nassatus TaxID=53992 RepID=A0AA36GVY6_CYLNA|nr:unnamed protein product [Cylicocyclus nassatus]
MTEPPEITRMVFAHLMKFGKAEEVEQKQNSLSSHAEVKFHFLLSEAAESSSNNNLDANGQDKARLPSIMKRQDLQEKRHLLRPDEDVYEESFVLDSLSPMKPERRPSHNQVEDDFGDHEHKKRRRRGRRRSGEYFSDLIA